MRYLVSQITLLTLVASPLLLSNLVHAKVTVTITTGSLYGQNSTDDDSTDMCKEECKEECRECQHPRVCDTYNRRYDETKNKTYANGATERLCSTEPANKKFGVTCPAVEKCEPITNKCPDPATVFKFKITPECKNDPTKCPKVPGAGVEGSKVECEGTKIVTCDNATQIFCAGLKGENQCTQDDTCEELESDSNGKKCPGVCPKNCEDDSIKCVKPTREGCPDDSICVTKSDLNAISKLGNPCPKLGDDDSDFCTPVCKDTQILCKGPIDEKTGCKLKKDQCVERGTGRNNTLCPGTCEKECSGVTQIKCKGPFDEDRCPTTDYCTEKMRDSNNAFCLDTSDSHECPVDCPEHQVDCEPKRDALGCKEQRLCHDKLFDEAGDVCPKSSICPTPCESNQISCPGGMEENGCPKPDLCVEKTLSIDGNVCPNNCPALCDDDQIKCPGHTEKNNCKSAETCHFRGTKSIGNDVDGLCPGYCPAVCKFNEIRCASQIDCDGCFTQELCKPKATNKFGQACPPESASHGCPLNCDANKGQTVCVSDEDEFGCKPKAQCVQRQKDNDGKWCPSADACPEKCMKLQLDCPGGFDQRGCKHKNVCKDRYIIIDDFWNKKNYNNEKKDVKIERLSSMKMMYEADLENNDYGAADDTVCPNHCPALCDPENEYECVGRILTERKCPSAPTCHRVLKDVNDKECPRVCPIKCGKNEIMLTGDRTESGCLKPFYCQTENIHWEADSGLTCFEFAENKWCENGGVGSAWNDSWTWEKDSEGLDARKACLTCGAKGGCKTIYAGRSNRNIAIDSYLKCPAIVDNTNMLEYAKSGKTFSVAHSGNQIQVTRTDKKVRNWHFNLKFPCCPDGCKSVKVGSSNKNTKTIPIDNELKCPSMVDKTNWMGGLGRYKDTFMVTHSENKITITRTDEDKGWGMNLMFTCCPDDVVDETKVTEPDENQADKTSEARVDETEATATITDQTVATAAVVNQVETPKTVVDQTDVLASNVDQTDVTTTVVDSQDDATPDASADVPATTVKPN